MIELQSPFSAEPSPAFAAGQMTGRRRGMRWKCFLTFSDQIFTEVEQSNMKNFLTFSDQIFMEVVLVSSVEQEEGWGVKALCWTLSGSFHSWIIET